MERTDLLHRFLYYALAAAGIFYFVVKFSLGYWKRRGILHEKPKFLWGNLKGVGRKWHVSAALQTCYAKHKGKAPFIGFYAYLKPMALVLDLDLVRCILKDDAECFAERSQFHNISEDSLTQNAWQFGEGEWLQVSAKLRATLDKQGSKGLLTLSKVEETFRRSLTTNCDEVVNINELVALYNEKSRATVADGSAPSLKAAKKNKFLSACLAFNFPWVAQLLRFTLGPIQKTPSLAEHTASIVDKSLAACNATMTHCLYELALQPQVQQKARDEIRGVVKKYENLLNEDCLNEMTYLKQILNETLRKYSPYPALFRHTLKDYEIPNSIFMLQRDNHVIVPIAAIHHDADIYPEPERFDPDRFTAKAIEARPAASFAPFGYGARRCLAARYAEMQMLRGLAALLKSYRFSACDATTLDCDMKSWMLTPKSEVKLRVQHLIGQ